ncbi:MAG: YbjN domain-containing protein [Sandaracinaceae bacterium]|nr:YbjN domain-containing protein [Sandaracinaceae bacterium]
MRTREDVEAYLAKSPYPFRELEESTWLVQDRSGAKENIVVRLSGDILLFRVHVIELEAIDRARREELYALLLELNASDMVHGAYGITRTEAGGKVLLTAAMRLQDLDYSELVGTLDDFSMALAKHYDRIARFSMRASSPPPAA